MAHRTSRLSGDHAQHAVVPLHHPSPARPMAHPTPPVRHAVVSPHAPAQASASAVPAHHTVRVNVQQQTRRPVAVQRSWSEDKDSELEMEEEKFLEHESPRAVHDCGLFDNDCNFKGTGPDRDRGNYMKARPQSLAQLPSSVWELELLQRSPAFLLVTRDCSPLPSLPLVLSLLLSCPSSSPGDQPVAVSCLSGCPMAAGLSVSGLWQGASPAEIDGGESRLVRLTC
eukprot:766255-Hanusia_phi.AAC.2